MSYRLIIQFLVILCFGFLALLPIEQASAKAFEDFEDETPEKEIEEIYDPLEFLNRRIFWFNDKVDKMALKPLAKGYRWVVPRWGRDRVHSVLENLSTPIYFFNAVMQGDVDQSFTSFWRFFMNTSFGIGGMFDIATLTSLEARQEDFGQTLGFYGMGPGPYLVLPILGPSTLRDATGRFVDSTVDPFNYVDQEFILTRHAVGAIDTREGLLEVIDQIEENSIDPYASMRSIYLQNQDEKVRNGTTLPSYKMQIDW